MASYSLRFITVIALGLLVSFPGTLKAETDKNRDFHPIHMMLNNGLNMILDGSSLIMMTEMDIDISFAKDPQAHGNMMIATGRKLIDRALKGPVMVDMHVKKMGLGSMMEATHELGELMLKTAYTQKVMQPATELGCCQKPPHHPPGGQPCPDDGLPGLQHVHDRPGRLEQRPGPLLL